MGWTRLKTKIDMMVGHVLMRGLMVLVLKSITENRVEQGSLKLYRSLPCFKLILELLIR